MKVFRIGRGQRTLAIGDDPALSDELNKPKKRQARKRAQIKRLEDSGEKQPSRTDPDARSLSKGKQHTVGYNVQQTVDAKHKLIVHHEVTSAGNDSEQLSEQCTGAMEVLGVETITAVADAGYYQRSRAGGLPGRWCQRLRWHCGQAQGRHRPRSAQRQALPLQRPHRCLSLSRRRAAAPARTPAEKERCLATRYNRPSGRCRGCALQGVCLSKPDAARSIYRSEHAAVVEAHRKRMAEQGAECMRQRAGLAEHPFGALKRWFGWDHFLVRGFEKVRGEMSLMVLGYNLTRVLNILGLDRFLQHCTYRVRRTTGSATA